MSDTPRTTALHNRLVKLSEGPDWIVGRAYCDMTDHARTLERELAAERAKVARLREVLRNIAEGCSFPSDDVQRACRDVARAALKDTQDG